MEFIFLAFLHFLADFILQPREMWRQKSSNWKYLTAHIAIQIAVFQVMLWPFYGADVALKFAWLNGLIHALIDASIWRGYALLAWKRRKTVSDKIFPKKTAIVDAETMKREWRYWEDHWFYVTIGFDQLLHISTLALLWEHLHGAI